MTSLLSLIHFISWSPISSQHIKSFHHAYFTDFSHSYQTKEYGTGTSSPTNNTIQRDDNNNNDNNNNNGGGGNVDGMFFLYVGSGEGDSGGWFGGKPC